MTGNGHDLHDVAVPDLAPSRVVGRVAGLRPFRPTGVRLELERIGDKTVVHDYGHGGSGVTLAPGTAAIAADLACTTPHRIAAVLGAGAPGLAAARALQGRGFDVRVYADAVSPATTSDVAGALWGAFSLLAPEHATPEAVANVASLARASHAHFRALDAARHGIRRVPLYLVHGAGGTPELPWEMAITPELFPLRTLGPGEHPFGDRTALVTDAMMIEPARFLRALHDDVLSAGGQIVARRFESRDEVLALEEPLIVNCTGLGSRTLFGDTTLEPVRGQLVLLEKQAGVDYVMLALDENAYLLPREDVLVVGGSADRNEWSCTVGDDDVARILAGARRMISGAYDG